MIERSEQVLVEWGSHVGDLRGDATARRVLPLLIAHPVVSSDLVALLVDVSERAARAALTVLADRGILEPFDRAPVGPGRPRRFWRAPDVLALITTWSPTVGGN